jgi:hypothetical protein
MINHSPDQGTGFIRRQGALLFYAGAAFLIEISQHEGAFIVHYPW